MKASDDSTESAALPNDTDRKAQGFAAVGPTIVFLISYTAVAFRTTSQKP